MGTRYQGTHQEIRALNAYIKLMRASSSITTRVHKHLTEFNLTFTQFAVLEALFHLGPLSQRDIGAKILRSGGNITMVVDNLEKRGLVTRERSSEDRRQVFVQITSQGMKLIEQVLPLHIHNIVKEMGVLSDDEQEELGRLCKKVGIRPGG